MNARVERRGPCSGVRVRVRVRVRPNLVLAVSGRDACLRVLAVLGLQLGLLETVRVRVFWC